MWLYSPRRSRWNLDLLAPDLNWEEIAKLVHENDVKKMALKGTVEIGRALSSYDKALFWEYSEREIPGLGPELVVPRVTRYGSLEEVIRLFVIYPVDVIKEVVVKDRELDRKERTLLNYFCVHGSKI